VLFTENSEEPMKGRPDDGEQGRRRLPSGAQIAAPGLPQSHRAMRSAQGAHPARPGPSSGVPKGSAFL